MNEVNLTYCPEGGEHLWELWYDEDRSKLIIDCDMCHQVARSIDAYLSLTNIAPLPVKLSREPGETTLNVDYRHEV